MRSLGRTREIFHSMADLAADLLEEWLHHDGESPVQPPRVSTKRAARRMAPAVERTLEVSPLNRQRARDALLRRGYTLKKVNNDNE